MSEPLQPCLVLHSGTMSYIPPKSSFHLHPSRRTRIPRSKRGFKRACPLVINNNKLINTNKLAVCSFNSENICAPPPDSSNESTVCDNTSATLEHCLRFRSHKSGHKWRRQQQMCCLFSHSSVIEYVLFELGGASHAPPLGGASASSFWAPDRPTVTF